MAFLVLVIVDWLPSGLSASCLFIISVVSHTG